MGAAESSVETNRADASSQPGLGDLPESCAASVLIHLDPPEICLAARLNKTFRAAASADLVWLSKLPENYQSLLEMADGDLRPIGLTKKEIYSRLCLPIPFDSGTKIFWLEKNKGGICMLISWKGLAITGIEDRRYWNPIPTDESRFQSVAYLKQTWWLEVDGEMEFDFPVGAYSVFYRLHLGRARRRLGRRRCVSDQVHGWDTKPVRFRLSTSCGQTATAERHLREPGVWKLHHVGDFVVGKKTPLSPAPPPPTKLRFSLTQIDCTHTKGGLCVDSVLVCPRGFGPQWFK